jgi:hypothetical protein
LYIGAWDSGTVGSLEACIFEFIAVNQKNLLNLLTNFLRSVQIRKGPTSDIGTLSLSEDQIVETFLYGSEILGYEENEILMRNVQLFILQTKRFTSLTEY